MSDTKLALVRGLIEQAPDSAIQNLLLALTEEGDRLMTAGRALTESLAELDGFYTFVVGTERGFAVLRDSIACKPAVMAETEDYVAFGSEYRALADLPQIAQARVFEPEPATVYVWEHK